MVKILPKLLLIIPLLFFIMLGLDKTRLQQYEKLQTQVRDAGENFQSNLIDNQNQELTSNQLKEIAKLVTVKIFTDDENNTRGGSGVIISKENDDYFVITNNHVVSDVNVKYKLKTYEGKVYPTKVIEQNNQDLIVDDLALLTFRTNQKYDVVNIKINVSIPDNEIIFASGFPFQENLQQSENIEYTLGGLKKI